MKRLIERYKRWKNWKKYNRNSWFYQIEVLLGIVRSPTFEFWFY